MNKVLKTKLAKGNSNSMWQEVFDNIEDYVSKKEVESFASDTISDIRSTIKGKKSAYGWSAGKDSIVLDDLCRKAGMKKSVMAMTQLEFPAFVNWVLANKPEGCEIRITHHNLKWLAQHQNRLFPEDAKGDNIWFQEVQRNTIAQYYIDNALDLIVLGRRTADGNSVPAKVVTKKNGQTVYCPIRDWPHEVLLGYIRYHGLPLPPIYDWEDGWIYGTHTWAVRRMRPPSLQGSWKSVYDIDPSVVVTAGKYIPSAREFLQSIGG